LRVEGVPSERAVAAGGRDDCDARDGVVMPPRSVGGGVEADENSTMAAATI